MSVSLIIHITRDSVSFCITISVENLEFLNLQGETYFEILAQGNLTLKSPLDLSLNF